MLSEEPEEDEDENVDFHAVNMRVKESDQKWTSNNQMDIADMCKDCGLDKCNLDGMGWAMLPPANMRKCGCTLQTMILGPSMPSGLRLITSTWSWQGSTIESSGGRLMGC